MSAFADLRTGHVSISAFPSANTAFVPEAIRRFRDAHPGIEVSLVRAGPEAIRAGELDLALVTDWDDIDDDVDLVPLLDEEHRVALPSRHPLARRTTVPLSELCDETWIEGAHPTASARRVLAAVAPSDLRTPAANAMLTLLATLANAFQ